jgi:ParB family chromosome partitioning protein
VEEGLSVRKVEELARKIEQNLIQNNQDQPAEKAAQQPYEALKNQLSDFFTAKVTFQHNNNGSGKIVIPFRSDDELERIIGIFDRLKE